MWVLLRASHAGTKAHRPPRGGDDAPVDVLHDCLAPGSTSTPPAVMPGVNRICRRDVEEKASFNPYRRLAVASRAVDAGTSFGPWWGPVRKLGARSTTWIQRGPVTRRPGRVRGRGAGPEGGVPNAQIGCHAADAQLIVTTRLLYSVHDRGTRLSRLQRIHPRAPCNGHPPAGRRALPRGARGRPARVPGRSLFVSAYGGAGRQCAASRSWRHRRRLNPRRQMA